MDANAEVLGFLPERRAHAPLVAAASVTHGVEVVVTVNHLNRTATSGCRVASCCASLFLVFISRRSKHEETCCEECYTH